MRDDDLAKHNPLADPQRLSDGKSPTFEPWKMLMQAKLDTDHNHFPSERHKVLYVMSRTEGKALEILGPRISDDSPVSIRTVKEAFKLLEDVFADRHRRTKARLALSRL